jgi:hypothetical protein
VENAYRKANSESEEIKHFFYWWFAIYLLRFTRQRHGGHVGKHTPNTIAVNEILFL